MAEINLTQTLQGLGVDIVKQMRSIIEINGKIATGNLLNSIKAETSKKENTYVLKISYPFYGQFIDEGRNPGPAPINVLKEWTRVKGLPESVAYIALAKLKREGYKGINFTQPFYDDIKVIVETLTKEYVAYVKKELQENKK